MLEARSMKKMGAALLALAMAGAVAFALSLSAGVGQAWAGGGASIDYLNKHKTVYVSYLGKKQDIGVRAYGSNSNISSIKSSNKKVATVKRNVFKNEGLSYYTCLVNLKKAGTTVISYKYKGKTHKVKYVVKNYKNPIKSFKIGSKQYKSQFAAKNLLGDSRGSYSTATSASSFSGKVAITPASGWKVNSIYTYASGMKKIKNKASVKKATFLQVELKNKKTGQIEEFIFTAAGKSGYKSFKSALKAA